MSQDRAPEILARMMRLPATVQMGIAAALGACGALAQAPYNQPIALLAALWGAFLLFRSSPSPRRAALLGWSFGVGYFALAMIWIVEPFQIDPDRHAWMAPFALIFMAGGLALFWGLAFWAARKLSDHAWPLVFTWTGVELLRAYVLTGFPWASPAQGLVDGMAGQALAWVGPHGVNFGLLALAWALSLPALAPRRTLIRAAQVGAFAGAALLLTLPPRAPDAPLREQIVRLVQPNVPQTLKWNPQHFRDFFQRHLDLTGGASSKRPDLVIWPEAAVPWFLGTMQSALPEIAEAAQGAQVIFGANRVEGDRLYNALAVLDEQGQLTHTYDKYKTVPFGEYIPLGNLLGRLGISGMASRDGHGFSRGPGPQVLDLGSVGRAQPLICYEAVFAHFTGATPQRPDLLIQITNDAWFGQAAGPQQHLAQARMRAIEQGLPLARSANTGISAMIDPWGRVTHSLALGAQGALDAPLPAPRPPTLYARTGDTPIMLLVGVILGAATLRRAAQRKSY